MKKVAVILSGSGVYDGSEIQEAVFALLAIAQKGAFYQCFAPNVEQHHVIDHLSGNEMPEKRNVLTESARIARGDIKDLKDLDPAQFDALLLPGGFGAAKNLSTWAFSGPDGDIHPEVQSAILNMHAAGKPICALCMGPAVVARAFKGSDTHPSLTVGTTAEASPYDIAAVSGGMEQAGAKALMRTVREVEVDKKNKIITAPCYMMKAGIVEVYRNVQLAVDHLFTLI